MMKTKITYVFLLINFCLFGQSISYDTTFGNNGIVNNSDNIFLSKTKITSNEKIITIGTQNYGSTGISTFNCKIVQYNIDGSIDASFGTNGSVFQVIENQSALYSFDFQSDAKIIASGQYWLELPPNGPGGSYPFIERFNSDGSLDTSFGDGGILKVNFLPNLLGYSINSVKLLPNDKIIAVGNYFSTAVLYQFNANGTPDVTFGQNGIIILNDANFNFKMSNFIILNDNNYLCFGSDNTISDNPKGAVIKLDPNGDYITAFGNNGKIIFDIYDSTSQFPAVGDYFYLAKEIDSKILLEGNSINPILVQLNNDGSFDSTFGINGIVNSSYLINSSDLNVQNDGKILLTASNASNDMLLVKRLFSNGDLDITFNGNGVFSTNTPIGSDCSLFQNDGKFLVTGNSGTPNNYLFTIIRLNIDDNLSVNSYNKRSMIFPNPTSGIVNFKIDCKINSVDLYNTFGQKILKYFDVFNQSINISNLNNGIYFLKIGTENRIITYKLILEK